MSVNVASAHLHDGAAAVGAGVGGVIVCRVSYERDGSAAALNCSVVTSLM